MQQLQQEWLALQQQSEDIEGRCLWLKMFNVGLCAWILTQTLIAQFWVAGLALVGVVYVIEAMYKTMQSRSVERLMIIEQAIAEASDIKVFQLHSQWLQQRPGSLGLLVEYSKQCVRPTVAFPHAVLIILLLVIHW